MAAFSFQRWRRRINQIAPAPNKSAAGSPQMIQPGPSAAAVAGSGVFVATAGKEGCAEADAAGDVALASSGVRLGRAVCVGAGVFAGFAVTRVGVGESSR